MEVAQVAHSTGMRPDTSQASTKAGIQQAKDVADEAVKGNYIGPLVSAVTFVRTTISVSHCNAIFILRTRSPSSKKPPHPHLSSFFPPSQPSYLHQPAPYMRPPNQPHSCSFKLYQLNIHVSPFHISCLPQSKATSALAQLMAVIRMYEKKTRINMV